MADPALDMAVQLVCDRADLLPILSQWDELARHALESNPLYEPGMMLPALEGAGAGELQCFLLWERDPERSDVPARLSGLFPFRREKRYRGLPAATLRSWSHPSWAWQTGTPLVHADGAQRTVAALLDGLARARAAVIEFRDLAFDSAFRSVLADALREHASTPFVEAQDVVVGIGALGEIWVSMLPLLGRRRGRPAARAGAAVAATQ